MFRGRHRTEGRYQFCFETEKLEKERLGGGSGGMKTEEVEGAAEAQTRRAGCTLTQDAAALRPWKTNGGKGREAGAL